MTILIPIAVSLLTTAAFWIILPKKEGALRGADLLPFVAPFAVVTLFTLVITALGYRQGVITAGAAALLFTFGGCAYLAYRRKGKDRRSALIRRLALATVIVVALEMSLFNYSAYSSPRTGEVALDVRNPSAGTMTLSDDGLTLSDSADSSAQWTVGGSDVKNVAVTLLSKNPTPVQITASASDRNFSTRLMTLNKESVIVSGKTTVYFPVSSQGMQTFALTFGKVKDVQLTAVTLNAQKTIEINPLRLILLMVIVCAAVLIVTCGLHRVEYQPGRLTQRVMTVLAAMLCIIALVGISAAHVGDSYTRDGLLAEYDGSAVGKDPYYQLFDAFQKGQVNLDIPVDERLITAGDLAYDSGYRSQQGISVAWDRAFYDGKYYSYFGTAPMLLFYYPVYFITGKVPTTALTCLFFSGLFVIFGFLLVFRIARTVVKNANYLLTLLAATVLPLAAGVYILTAYGDFYNLPKLCALSFLLLMSNLSIAGYERPRWWIFLLCGICGGVIMAARPNVLIAALGLAPLYIGVLAKRDFALAKKLLCVAAFLVPVAAAGVGLMAYNTARFGSPLEFGVNYQLTVNNVAMNNVSFGMFGQTIYYFFLMPPNTSTEFPFLTPQYNPTDTHTRYFYITAAYGALSLPLNWSLAAYPAVRRTKGLKPAYRATLITTLIAAVIVAWLDYAMAGVTISYVGDIATSVALVAITVLLLAEKKSRENPGVHRGVSIGGAILLCATFVVGVLLLLGTEPLFVKNGMPAVYGNIQDIFRF